jgi:hypothetical protein
VLFLVRSATGLGSFLGAAAFFAAGFFSSVSFSPETWSFPLVEAGLPLDAGLPLEAGLAWAVRGNKRECHQGSGGKVDKSLEDTGPKDVPWMKRACRRSSLPPPSTHFKHNKSHQHGRTPV